MSQEVKFIDRLHSGVLVGSNRRVEGRAVDSAKIPGCVGLKVTDRDLRSEAVQIGEEGSGCKTLPNWATVWVAEKIDLQFDYPGQRPGLKPSRHPRRRGLSGSEMI